MQKNRIFGSCGCGVESFDDLVQVRFKDQTIDFDFQSEDSMFPVMRSTNAVVYGLYCSECAEQLELSNDRIMSDEEERKWLDGCPEETKEEGQP